MKITQLFTALMLSCLLLAMAPPFQTHPSTVTAAPAYLGENAFGYTVTSPGYNWVELFGSAEVTFVGSDEDAVSTPIPLGFSMPFFEHSYNTVYVSINGLLSFVDISAYQANTNAPIPVDDAPNTIVAPLWDDLILKTTGYADGKIFFASGIDGGRSYLAIEWYRVLQRGEGTISPMTFEVLLYENGEIVFNYQTIPSGLATATIGIEDGEGVDGVQYRYDSEGPAVTSGSALGFDPPPGGPRVKAFPKYRGEFFSNQSVDFPITIRNTGTSPDTFNLTASSVSGELVADVFFRSAVSQTRLTDTNGDGVPDTGPVAAGIDSLIVLRVITNSTTPGDYTSLRVTATSTIDPSKQFDVVRDAAIPAQFAHAINNSNTGANVLFSLPQNQMVEQPAQTVLSTIPALVRVSRYVYLLAWEREIVTNSSNIEYLALNYLSRYASPVQSIRDNAGGGNTRWSDSLPVIASTPDEKIGVLFIRKKYDISRGNNENVVFALLNSNGEKVSEIPLTNNADYGFEQNVGIDFYNYPAIAATKDNKFILAWERTRWIAEDYPNLLKFVDIYTTVLDNNGNVQSQTRLTRIEDVSNPLDPNDPFKQDPFCMDETQSYFPDCLKKMADRKDYHEPVLTPMSDGGAYLVFSVYDPIGEYENIEDSYSLGDVKFDSNLNEVYRGLI